jgi:hypothetical protein
MANKRQSRADQRAQSKAVAKRTAITRQEEQQYVLNDAKMRAEIATCDDSPNLAAEFVLVRQIIQRMIDDGLPAAAQLPFIKIEESLVRSMLAMGLQLTMLIPSGSLKDAACAIASAVDHAFAIHSPNEREAAVEWLKEKLGEALLDDTEREEQITMPPVKQVYRFDQAPASANLSLGGSLRLLRFYIQQALDSGDWDFVLLLIKQLITSSHTQLSLAKVEGLLVSREVSRRMIDEFISLASLSISTFAPDLFDTIIDSVRETIAGPPQQTYRIAQ